MPSPRMKIAVLMGGASEERDVSLASGAGVARALREAGHEVVAFDTARGVLSRGEEAALLAAGVGGAPPALESLDLLDTGNMKVLTHAPEMVGVDILFLALHGGAGEDGTLQTLLDVAGLPYVGSGRVGAALAMDKDLSKRLMRDEGVPTPEWVTAVAGALTPDEVEARLGLPVIVKPPSGGSTVGLTLAHDRTELRQAIAEAARFEERILFERYIPGREFTVSVLGDEALPVGEIIPVHEIFDYECKYQPGMAEEIFPAELPVAVSAHLQALALRVHRLLRLEDFSRIDFILDGDGVPWCLEANALPGLTANSLLPRAALAAGIVFPDLCERICLLAMERRRSLGGGGWQAPEETRAAG